MNQGLLKTYIDLFLGFAKVGIFGFGGGPGSISLIQAETVERYHWMTSGQFANVLAIGNALPGPIATKLAGYIGYKTAGIVGLVAALLGVMGPSLLALIIFFNVIDAYRHMPWAIGLMKAVQPVIVVILGLLVYDLMPKAITNWQGLLIAAVSFIALKFLNTPTILVIVLAMGFGAIFVR